ncbi:chorismate synthase [Fusobacterium mortiferum]|uniref:chorismate synthase n=1 Tax=Fusobacterium mortiferum TaxID=850 RepID=UPI001959BAD0|nr:chorismate synthase [Fusobacterium mortiferum]
MGANWGHSLRLSIFGESHGKAIGINIDGLASGIELDFESIEKNMERRAPGRNKFSTQRKESDSFEILSGIYEGKTTGAPLCAIIRNEDKKSKDYSKLKEVMRPNHSDYPAFIKYRGNNDVRGGGHFSGRITAPIVFAGSIAKTILAKKGIYVGASIKSIKNIEVESLKMEELTLDAFDKLAYKEMAILSDKKILEVKEEIEKARINQDSVGGTIECFAIGVPAGLGEPFFDSLESSISHLAFSIPAVKGIEFGKGFDITRYYGSEIKDEYYYEGEKIKTKRNNNGGILGGLSTGMPISFRVAIKPTPSISKIQNTVNIKTKENCELVIEGRHDPCIVPRAVVVIESVMAIALLDKIYEAGGKYE